MFSYTRNGSLELNSEFYYGAYIATNKHGTEEYFSQSFVTCSFQFFFLTVYSLSFRCIDCHT